MLGILFLSSCNAEFSDGFTLIEGYAWVLLTVDSVHQGQMLHHMTVNWSSLVLFPRLIGT